MEFTKTEIGLTFPKSENLLVEKLLKITIEGPLNGIMVLEIGQHVSGPMVGERLARKGAFVVKTEMPIIGDPARIYMSQEIFASLNASKASIIIKEDNLATYANLLQLADVIIDNRSPEAKEKDKILNKFFAASDKTHPVIYCSIVGYEGEENKHLLALDVSVQAATGMAYVNGSEPTKPLKVGFVVLDEVTAIEASDLIASHLFALARGKKIPLQNHNLIKLEVSMAKVSASLMAGQYLNCQKQKKEPSRSGNKDNWVAPFSFYSTKDDIISIAIVDEKQYKRLCINVLENEDLFKNFDSNSKRMQEYDKFEAALTAILITQTTDYWIEKCEQFKIPASKVNTVTQALQQPFAKNFFTETTSGTTIIADSYSSSLYGAQKLPPAPALDEHRVEIECLLSKYMKMKITKESSTFQDLRNSLITLEPDVSDKLESMFELKG